MRDSPTSLTQRRLALSSLRVRTARLAVLGALAEEVGETCNLSVPEQEGMIYVDRVETHWPMRFQLPIGSTVPFHCTAAGKMFLSSLDEAELDKLLSAIELDSLARNTITDQDALKEELALIRKRAVFITLVFSLVRDAWKRIKPRFQPA